MPISTTDFPALTDDLQTIFNSTAKMKIADSVGMKIFGVRETNRRTHDHLTLHGADAIREVTPGADLPTVTLDQGDTITYTQRYFGGKFAVTKAMRKFDLYEQIESLARNTTVDAFDKVDYSMADVLTFGTSTSYTDIYGGTVTATGPDGLALFNASHTFGIAGLTRTYSNITTDGTNSNPALSRQAVVRTRARAMAFRDAAGNFRPVRLDTIVVAPTNEDLAERIVFSNQMSGTGNNDTNPLKGKIKQILTWERIDTRSDGTDTSAYWFLCDSSQASETLKAFFAERPTLDAPEQVYKNKNWEYTVDYFYSWGFGFQAFVNGSTGVN